MTTASAAAAFSAPLEPTLSFAAPARVTVLIFTSDSLVFYAGLETGTVVQRSLASASAVKYAGIQLVGHELASDMRVSD